MLDASNDLKLTPYEREHWRVLIIEPDDNERQALRQALGKIGIKKVSTLEDNKSLESWFLERHAKFLLFSDEDITIAPEKFVPRFVEINEGSVPIVMSKNADLDQIFDLLALGVRGCLLRPFDADSLEHALGIAAKGEPFSEHMLGAEDRYGALIELLANNIDSVSTAMSDAQKFKTAQRRLSRLMVSFRHSAGMANVLGHNGEVKYLEAVQRVFEKRSKFPVTRLGRLRRKLAQSRSEPSLDE